VHPPAITAIPRPGGRPGKFWPRLHCDAMTVAKHKAIAACGLETEYVPRGPIRRAAMLLFL
jgi:hypothetical protein